MGQGLLIQIQIKLLSNVGFIPSVLKDCLWVPKSALKVVEQVKLRFFEGKSSFIFVENYLAFPQILCSLPGLQLHINLCPTSQNKKK